MDMLRAAIDKYYQDNQQWPATLDTSPHGQLPAFIPNYMQAIPLTSLRLDNPHTNSNNVQLVSTEEDGWIMSTNITDAGGWIYSPNSGDLRLNCTHTDTVLFDYNGYPQIGSLTCPYYQYRHEADKGYRWQGLHGEINCGSCIVGCKGGTPTVALPEYIVKYATVTITEENWNHAAAYTVTTEPKLGGMPDQAVVPGLQPDTNYYFTVKTSDWARDISGISNVVNLYGVPTTGEEPLIITIASGNNQQTTVTTTLLPFVVQLTDTYNNPASSYPVTWQIIEPANGAVLSATTTITNVNGTSSVILTLGTNTGTYTITAKVGELTATFTAVGTANTPPFITITHPTITGAEADTSYLIGWIDSDPDSNAAISLYYDNDNTVTDGTLIVGSLSEDDENDTYEWNASGFAPGSYYIYALITDGSSTVCSYSPGSITIDHRQSDGKRLAWHDNGVWLTGDIHMHTKESDGSKLASEVANKAKSYGLDFIAITDHADDIVLGTYHSPIMDARNLFPSLVIFEGAEWNVPGAEDGGEHAAVMVTNSPREHEIISSFITTFDNDGPSSNTDDDAVAGLQWLATCKINDVLPVCSLNHPSRDAGYRLDQLRDYSEAGSVCVGFAGDWGHKKYSDIISLAQSMNGYHDPKTAWIGDNWDQLLSEGRKWLIRFEDDFHGEYGDYWPGEYSKTYYYCPSKTYEGVLKGIRGGCSYAVHNNIITGLEFTASCGTQTAMMGETLDAAQGQAITLTIRVQPGSGSLNGIELISNLTGTAASTCVFTSNEWTTQGDWRQMQYNFTAPNHNFYLRLRGSATTTGTITPWFYANPIIGSVTLAAREQLIITIATRTTLGTISSPPVPGADITYCLTYENTGTQAIQRLSITDKPDLTHAEYVADSLRMGTAGSTYETAREKTDDDDNDDADWDGTIVIFDVGTVPPSSSGRLYFRVRIR